MFSNRKYHPFHLVTPSPWPFLISIAAFTTALGATLYMHNYTYGSLMLTRGLIHVVFAMGFWWRDVVYEATFEGNHTKEVQESHRIGFILFIASEVMFFFGFFWAFFHFSVFPTSALACIWPPTGLVPFNPIGIPLLNTFILLCSGATITVTHHALIMGKKVWALIYFLLTIILAVAFTLLQFEEYLYAPFAISDATYGSVFYMITGLHGFHVIIGTLFIIVCAFRTYASHFTNDHHIGFEFSAWYWHFVDVVWLFVYVFIYWWGGAFIKF
jgi:heme/copper-type cytochrome/quinol oxidase subunit 3